MHFVWYDKYTSIWYLRAGMVLYELATGKPPWNNLAPDLTRTPCFLYMHKYGCHTAFACFRDWWLLRAQKLGAASLHAVLRTTLRHNTYLGAFVSHSTLLRKFHAPGIKVIHQCDLKVKPYSDSNSHSNVCAAG